MTFPFDFTKSKPAEVNYSIYIRESLILALKLVILAEESGREVSYVNKESKKPHGPYVDAYPEEEDPWYED